MPWETRKGGTCGPYYRRKVGKARVYYGRGPLAEAMAVLDVAERAERAAEERARREERARYKTVERHLDALDLAVNNLLAEALTAAGYHRHKRGEWRKRRGG